MYRLKQIQVIIQKRVNMRQDKTIELKAEKDKDSPLKCKRTERGGRCVGKPRQLEIPINKTDGTRSKNMDRVKRNEKREIEM